MSVGEGISLAALRGDLSMPSTWQQVGKVAKLYIYPIKSLANVQVEKFEVKANGAENNWTIDRQFMVVDRKGKMVTARKFPHMSMVVPMVTKEHLVLSYPGMEKIKVKIPSWT